MERCPSCWFHRERPCRDGSSADGPGFKKKGRLRMARGRLRMALETQVQVVQKTIEIQRFAVRGEHRWIFDIQTSERLGTASVRGATPAEIVEVIEIAAPLPSAELASPMSVTASARVEKIVLIAREIVFMLGHPGTSAPCT